MTKIRYIRHVRVKSYARIACCKFQNVQSASSHVRARVKLQWLTNTFINFKPLFSTLTELWHKKCQNSYVISGYTVIFRLYFVADFDVWKGVYGHFLWTYDLKHIPIAAPISRYFFWGVDSFNPRTGGSLSQPRTRGGLISPPHPHPGDLENYATHWEAVNGVR